jgi:DNA-directed RNA polymerase specialized sigma24 family protein
MRAMQIPDTPRPRGTSRRPLTHAEWTGLLAALDSDAQLAAEKYETARAGLIRIFRSQGLWSVAEELADETIDRSARRLLEKSTTDEPIGNILAYMRAVAARVATEARRHPAPLPLDKAPEPSFLPEEAQEERGGTWERALGYLRQYLRALPASDRKVIVEYYRYSEGEKIERHRSLAHSRNQSSGALRVKACRIRRRLGEKLREALGAEGEPYGDGGSR